MLRCLSRLLPVAFLTVIITLFFLNSISYAVDGNNGSDQEDGLESSPLTLDTEVVVPHSTWLPTQDADVDRAPSMAITPAPPLEPPPLKNITLMLDWYLSPQHAALVIARERGLYAAQGLEVDIQSPADPSIAIKLLTAGDVDLALTRQPLLHLHAHEGAPITRIATLIETPLTAVVVMGAEPTETNKNLAGLHYGYTTREGLN
ncbi:unnamed protein product, partial [Ectocarpus sp. 12 AP-2014]